MSRAASLFYDALDELIANKDELFVPEVKSPRSNGDDLVRLFLEIVGFRERTGAAPKSNARAPEEMRLGVRLDTFRVDPAKVEKLMHLDQYGLLASAAMSANTVPTSIDELIDADDDLLATTDDHIFEFKATPAPQPKSEADLIAERIPCKDFAKFQPIFDECVADIANGARATVPTTSTYQIEVGDMFIVEGSLAYIAEVGDWQTRNGQKDARLRIIYDNGTESDHLLRSFGKALYRADNSRRVQKAEAGPLFEGQQPRVTGCIYVARTHSEDPNLRDLVPHILKIGSTTGAAEERISSAAIDPTFLLADASIVSEFETRGVPPKKIENLLHRFFAEACVNIRIPDRFGRTVDPREWFVVTPATVDQAMRLIATRSLHLYKYDLAQDAITLK